MKQILLFIIVSFFTSALYASAKDIALDLNFGYPQNVSIMNPDGTEALYEGFGIKAKLLIPLNNSASRSSDLRFNLALEYKYLEFKNTANGSISEDSRHQGFAGGLNVRLGAFYLSGSYGFMKASHKSTGTVSALSSYKYNPINTEVGLLFPYSNVLEIGGSYSYTTAVFNKSETGLTKNSDYKEQMIWLKAIFYFDKN